MVMTMDYEKKYKEALERAREYWETDNGNTLDIKAKGTMEYLFPELAESEDERIRKELITHCKNTRCVTEEGAERIAKWIAWLEKQGEHTEINPSEFDLRLNKLLKQFESLPKEELISNLSYYLNIIQNDGTYKIEKQGEKSQRMISAEAKEAMYDKPTCSEEDEVKINRIVACLENLNIADNDILLKDVDWLKSLKKG